MTARIRVPATTAIEMLRHLARLSEMHGDSPGYVRTVLEIGLDLAEARVEMARLRTRIADLERLSASQALALDEMEAGRL